MASGEPADYDDEVQSQKRVRWMTQVLVMPPLCGALWAIAYGLGYWGGIVHCHGGEVRLHVLGACGVAALALLLWFIVRGKLGARRRWVNAVLLLVLLPLGATGGWRSVSDSPNCLATPVEEAR